MSHSSPPVPQSESTPEAPATGPDASNLPPEALDLASKLFDHARAGSPDDLATYISVGISPNLSNSKGDTLLMLASYHGHVETVSMLLEKGADPNALND